MVLRLFLILFISCVSYSQTMMDIPHDERVHDELQDFLIMSRGEEIDFTLLDDFTGMWVVPNETMLAYHNKSAWGITLRNNDNGKFITLINDQTPQWLPTFKNAVVYHEMFHLLTNNEIQHCDNVFCPQIMSSSPNIEGLIRTWNFESKKHYFAYLRQSQLKLNK